MLVIFLFSTQVFIHVSCVSCHYYCPDFHPVGYFDPVGCFDPVALFDSVGVSDSVGYADSVGLSDAGGFFVREVYFDRV